MRIFVTGGYGFIGRAVVEHARAAGHEVFCLTSPWRMDNLPLDQLKQFRPEGVIHCAWVTTPGLYLESPDNVLHRKWSIDMVKSLVRVGATRFVVLGTCAEYAASNADLDEERSIKAPVSLYGAEKHALHNDLEKMSRELGYELIWLRLFYPYGPSEDSRRLVSSMIKGFRAGSPVRLLNPDAERDYVHISDVAAAVLWCATGSFDGTFNVGSGTGVILSDIEKLVRQQVEGQRETSHRTRASGGAERVVAEITKLRSVGWEPQFDIRSGIESYFEPQPKNTSSRKSPLPIGG